MYRAIYDLSRSHFLPGVLWLGAGVAGLMLVLLSAAMPD